MNQSVIHIPRDDDGAASSSGRLSDDDAGLEEGKLSDWDEDGEEFLMEMAGLPQRWTSN